MPAPFLTGARVLAAFAALTLVASATTADDLPEMTLDTMMAERIETWRLADMPEALITQIEDGAAVFLDSCAVCHGNVGEGGAGYAYPIINTNSLDKFRTAQRLFLYNRDLMPFDEPGTLPPDTVWKVSAWIMAMNGWLDNLDAPLGPDNARDVPIAP